MKSKLTLFAASALATMATPVLASSALETLIKDGKTNVDLRYRYEGVDQDGLNETAEASTLRTRLTVETGQLGAVSFKLEMDDSRPIGPDNYNSTTNGKTDYPIVADPKGTDLNQAYMQIKSGGFTAIGGRQRILLDDQRFVGGVGWRQNEQTYDGARAMYKAGSFNLDASYIVNVNRIFGPNGSAVQAADWRGDIGLLNGSYSFTESHKVSVFYYTMDFENAAAASNNTLGVKYAGKFGPVAVGASYAVQEDAGDNPVKYEADYYSLDAGVKVGLFNFKLGYEVLGSDEGKKGFQTPLATLHKWQGWADKFLGTPNDGIQDAYAGAGVKAGPVKLDLFYHSFTSDFGSRDLGSELDFVAVYPINKQMKLVGKFADYSADKHATDTQKVWLMFQLSL